jgi:hypothetical protein
MQKLRDRRSTGAAWRFNGGEKTIVGPEQVVDRLQGGYLDTESNV